MTWILFLSVLFCFVFSGVWLGIAMGGTGLVLLHFLGGKAASLAALSAWNYLNTYSLAALPIFLFMGEILVVSGLSKQIYSSLAPLFERLPGKLLHTNIFVCALFSAISGSSMATAAAVGSFVYPELDRRNYNRPTVAASLAGAGTLGILIPPSMALIIYGAWQDVSVGKLFIAGVIPGVMMTALFMIYIGILSKVRPNITADSDEKIMPLWQAIKKTVNIWPIAILIFVIIGTIYLGLATPTESAGLGAVAALILGAVFGNLRFRLIGKALFEAARISGLIGFIIVGASVLAQSVAIIGLPRELVMFVKDSGLSPIIIVIAIYALYAVMGCFFGAIEMLLMTLPFTYPVIMGLGYDPVWFGIVVVMVIEIGQLTPPLGVNLYVIQGITEGQLSLEQIALASIPYWALLLLGLAIITMFPQICLWLPSQSF